MIEVRTVFVLGAGASAPMEFPTGHGLMNQVVTDLSQPATISELQTLCGFNEQVISHFRMELMHSGQTSVDAFLEHREDFLEIGKAEIALNLIKCESRPRIYNDYVGAWYKYLFGRMNSPFEHFGDNLVSFLTFNYDRSLEEFLFTSLSKSYGKSDKECVDQLKKIPIIHLHGTLGNLPWQGDNSRTFETIVNQDTLNVARHGIKIVHEDISDGRDKDFQKGLNLLQNAKRIVFLGFGYNSINMKRLGIEHASIQAVGTGQGLTNAEIQDIQSAWQKISIHQTDCLNLLRSISWR